MHFFFDPDFESRSIEDGKAFYNEIKTLITTGKLL